MEVILLEHPSTSRQYSPSRRWYILLEPSGNPLDLGSAYLQSMDFQREPQSNHPTGENPRIYTVGVPFLVLFKKTRSRLIYTMYQQSPFLVLFQKYTLYQQTQRGEPLVLVARGWTFSAGGRSANTSSRNKRNRVDTPPNAHVDSAVLQPAVLYVWYTQLYLIQIRKLPTSSTILRN